MVGTLFLYLQDALASGGFSADPTLARIIRQDSEIAGAISIATTRVPDFGEQISNPSHGFRSLCCLGTVLPQLQDIPQTFHPSYELLASKTQTDNPVAICFAESFQPMGIDLISHFNIIFYPVHVSSIPSLWRISNSAESSLSPWDSISAVQSRNNSPQVDTCNPSQLLQPLLPDQISSSSCDIASPHVSSQLSQPLLPLLPDQNPSSSCDKASHASSPYDSANAVRPPNHLSPLHSPSPSPPSPLSLLRLQSLPSPLPPPAPCSISGTQGNAVGQSESSILEFRPSLSELAHSHCSDSTVPFLQYYVISEEQREAAAYKRGFKGLYLKVRNFNAMNCILEYMGYSLPFRVTADPTIKLSNIAVKASEVLQYFGWAPTSFEHKTLWYGTAKTLSQRSWKGSVPGK